MCGLTRDYCPTQEGSTTNVYVSIIDFIQQIADALEKVCN